MKIAVLALTNAGRHLARRIAGLYTGQADLYFKEGTAVAGREHSFVSLSGLVGDLCKAYDGLVFVMAAGIVVRVIAPFLQHKSLDPAVVVVDEGANFSISLLAGHLGGANCLARRIAQLIGATPVITTASDVQGRPAIDMVARKLNLGIEPFDNLKFINGALVNGDAVGIYTDMPRTVLLQRCTELAAQGIEIMPMDEYPCGRERFTALAAITDRVLDVPVYPPLVFLRPHTLIVGIGCRRGVVSEDILRAVYQSCALSGRSAAAVKMLATVWLKADEDGLCQAAEVLRVPVRTFTREALAEAILQHGLTVSKYVREQIGVGAVCEPAAILGADQGQLILTKQKFPGITVAIAGASCPWWV